MSGNVNTYPVDNSKNTKSETLSDYSIKGVIGRGTFSVVKLGENTATKEKVAIKILQKSKIINKEDFIRINREIEMLKSLNHPNVIKIYKIIEDSKKFCIIMEYCQKGELFNHIVEKHRLNEDEAAYFYYQIICGLEYIHKNNIAHRDLKPENLLLSKDDILKIIDFGLSNYSGINTLLGTPCGSPCYASPEMVSGKKYNGFLIDIWSTGIILFAMICGYLPFEDDDNEILFGKILNCQIKYPRIIGELPLDLMKKIIVPEPNKRITLNKIKEHSFYLKGKLLFTQKHPEIQNYKIKEIIIRNVSPNIIKHKSMKIKDIKDNNNRGKLVEDNLRNVYQSSLKENSDLIQVIANNDNPIVKSYDFSINDKPYQINYNFQNENKDNDFKKANYMENKNKNSKLESPSSYLASEEIPMDSVPKDFNEEKKEKQNKIKLINNKKVDIIKSINIKNSQNIEYNKISNILKSIKNNKEKNSVKSQKVTINLVENFPLNNKLIKKPKNSFINKQPENIILNKDKNNNKLKERIVIEYYPNNNNNLSHTIENTSANTNNDFGFIYNTENKNNDNKSKYSVIAQQIPKTSFINNKTTSIYEEKNNILIKENYISNSVPKNNEKNNYNGEIKYPHNNHNSIKNNNFHKTIQNSYKYENPNLNSANENDINLSNINNATNSRVNDYLIGNKNNNINTVRTKSNNKQNIFDIFNELQLIQKNKNKILESNNSKTIYYNNLTNIYENNSSARKTLDYDYTTNLDINKIPKNKYINHNQNNKMQNNVDIYSDRDYTLYKNSYQKKINESEINQSKKILNPNNNLEGNILTFNRNENLNDRFFESITINNNNSINLHEPKLYIYVENNNKRNNENKIRNAKTYYKEDNSKRIIKSNKKNNTNKCIKKKNILNVKNISDKAEHTKKIINKKPYIFNELNNKIFSTKKLDNIYKSSDGNRNRNIKSANMLKENNQNFLDLIRSKDIISKRTIDTSDINNNYFLNSDNLTFNLTNKNNINYLTNRNQNIINNYYNNFNNNSNNIINHSSKNNKAIIDNNDNFYPIVHNIIKTDGNMDNWTYDINILNEEQNILNNKYDFKDNKKIIIGKNVNANNINNYINNAKPISNIDNLEHKIKLQRLQKRNFMSYNLNDKNKYLKKGNEIYKLNIPKAHYIRSNIDYFENNNRSNTIENSYSPLLKYNIPNQRHYKKVIK